MQCQILSIGDELLIGDTVNTNASWMARELTEIGVEVNRIYTIKDDLAGIKEIVNEALSSADVVFTTGGLGPTHDDMTKQAIAELLDSELVVHEPTLDFIKKIFKERNIPFSKSNYHQAEVIEGCEVLFNEQGTAPAMWFDHEGALLVVLPGVPYEMKHLMNHHILPRLKKKIGNKTYRASHYMLTAGIGESTLSDEIIGDLNPFLNGNDISLAYLPSPEGTRIRIRGQASTEQKLKDQMETLIGHIKKQADGFIVGEGKQIRLAEKVGESLQEVGLKIAVAESCTGGSVANSLTDIPGSSNYFKGGIIAYENEVKVNQLKVNANDLQQQGAVSKAVALQMAKGVAQQLNAHIGISTTGIAGPEGGTDKKPVGTVWIGFWSEDQHFAIRAQFTNDRLINKQRTTATALEMVRRILLDISEMPYGLKKQLA
ncbi:competence/damage-inducible protein A [Fodinibius salsisoli]|uniref:CinA-like protein n=1 Tax=Fodinibius salsisoli TaxID=2820877 RepID=A0ABT3PQH0_9BACT|nr:competence/damage-inducible protein A [Fodinibius salsisoli]MCW9708104.1 competence/damage-inducible protein A [Fodinibius salsisoli]